MTYYLLRDEREICYMLNVVNTFFMLSLRQTLMFYLKTLKIK